MFKALTYGTTLLRAVLVASAFTPTQFTFTCPARPLGIFASMASKTSPAPPQAPNNFIYTPSDIHKLTDTAIARSRKLEDEIAALKPEQCTFDSVVKRLALDEGQFDTETDPATFMQSVSTEKEVSQRSSDDPTIARNANCP